MVNTCTKVFLIQCFYHYITVAVSSVLSVRHNLSVLTESDLCIAVRDTLIDAIAGRVVHVKSTVIPMELCW